MSATGENPFRYSLLIILVLSIGISGYHRRKARIATGTIPRSRDSMLLNAGRLLFALPLFAAFVFYIANPRWMAWSQIALPMSLRWLGVVMGLFMAPAVYWVVSSIGSNISETILTKAQHQLVTHGPYRWIRHPLYTSGILLLLATGLLMASWFVIALSIVVAVLMRLVVIPREEAALRAKFGERYDDYSRNTGRLFPKLWG